MQKTNESMFMLFTPPSPPDGYHATIDRFGYFIVFWGCCWLYNNFVCVAYHRTVREMFSWVKHHGEGVQRSQSETPARILWSAGKNKGFWIREGSTYGGKSILIWILVCLLCYWRAIMTTMLYSSCMWEKNNPSQCIGNQITLGHTRIEGFFLQSFLYTN